MRNLESALITNKYTAVRYEEPGEGQLAPHRFFVNQSEPESMVEGGVAGYKELAEINFQNGPIKDAGVNGVMNEDLIAMVICRLEHFQKSDFACRENAEAITKLEESLMWLRKRTMGREIRGVEGTRIK